MVPDTNVRIAAPLLRLIRTHESRGNYDAVWGRIAAAHRPPKPITHMTIAEVLAWQDSIDHLYRSEAAGAYQFLEDTLREIYGPAGLAPTDMFNTYNQDRLGVYLLKRRGLVPFLRGDRTASQFANDLAKEWASFPVVGGPKHGQSYYDGDGLNKALVSPEEVLSVLGQVKQGPLPPPAAPPTVVGPTGLGALIQQLLSLLQWRAK